MTNPTKGDIMNTNTTPRDEDLGEQIEHAIESILDLGNPPHEQDSLTGEPFVPESVPVDGVPAVSDVELEQQALAHPGADGDPSTAE